MKLRLAFVIALLISLAESLGVCQQCSCLICENPMGQRSASQERYWRVLQRRIQSRRNNMARPSLFGAPDQLVYLDFDSGNNGAIEYSPERRDLIQAEMEIIYQDFLVAFTQELPAEPFSTIVFNEGGAGSGNAEDIDFRNLNLSDNAVLNVDGIGLSDDQIVPASANIAAHELGHLLGLRHAEIFGPIGNGVIAGFGPFYTPDYFGPQDAFEAYNHIMATGAFGAPLSTFVTPSWLSERSGVKLICAEQGIPTDEVEDNDSIEMAQPLVYQTLIVPNTIVEGANAGVGDLSFSSIVVVGTLGGLADGQDTFRIEADAGDLLSLEVMSNVPDRLAIDPIDPNVSVFNPDGTFVDYYGQDAFNEAELESADAAMVDFVIPASGSYYVRVDSIQPNDSGQYELFIYRFNGIVGDVNRDESVDLLDVDPFVDLLVSGGYDPRADVNADQVVNLLDVDPFVMLLGSQ